MDPHNTGLSMFPGAAAEGDTEGDRASELHRRLREVVGEDCPIKRVPARARSPARSWNPEAAVAVAVAASAVDAGGIGGGSGRGAEEAELVLGGAQSPMAMMAARAATERGGGLSIAAAVAARQAARQVARREERRRGGGGGGDCGGRAGTI